ncbi:Gfo/Idh/MocA family oxidoreductase [Pediococcus parvulus]|uniref:NAD(P)-dependent oxidoreductase n=1 Tax=Pediococcus parvulus TaxID=54062 RepID=A0AAP5TAL7_9LACO|nr:Gfo/Idh/MocA family oxidoreductase [Pediococcus parvulus]MDV7693526.1 NAD(P)-dependent oxidoreductase [Pediococcus parvulus]
MINVAYIGNGKSTNRYHLPFILKLKDRFNVKTIYSPSGRIRWTKIPDVHYTTSLDDIYNDPEIQLVVVTTPSQFHYATAKDALSHGKNVVVEKPFAETADQARELFDLAKQKHLFIQCYQNRRFDSDFLTVQKVINGGLLGDLLEVESNYDYYRPEVPEQAPGFSKINSFLYGHGCHTLDQVLSFFGNPDTVHYDVRQLLGSGHMNDYFDISMYYGQMKVRVASSYFRIKPRPSFVVYGKKGMFVKERMDRQEEHLKLFYMPNHEDFGIDRPEDYGTLTYYDDNQNYHEQKVVTINGDYSRVYAGVYATLAEGQKKLIKDEETIQQIKMLEQGIKQCH